ncbi:MAG: DUF4143 domain-containing protein [Bacillota bacterium]|nr:DUF4143 domain-containing protein [Bacillota bacterium]
MDYRYRIIDEQLDSALSSMGATLIVGPKACGKTTTAKSKAKTVIEFQDEEKREALLEIADISPSSLLQGDKPILFDEWQDAPKIWGAVRKYVDDNQSLGAFILTGSTAAKTKTPHSGTGRISRLRMYPMSLYESGESSGGVSLSELFQDPKIEIAGKSPLTLNGLIRAICRGGWPASLRIANEHQLVLAKSIYEEICEEDISRIDGKSRNPKIARAVLRSYGRNLATLASGKTILDDIRANFDSLSDRTLADYIEALQKLYIIEDIGAWCPAIRSKTAIRSSEKRNLVDPSIAVAALGLSPEYFYTDFKTLGFLFECLCIRDLRVYSSKLGGKVSYYHDRYGLEADCVLHLDDGNYALIEFKLGGKGIETGASHLNELERLIDEHNKAETQVPIRPPRLKMIVTGGELAYRRPDGVYVVPVGCLKP